MDFFKFKRTKHIFDAGGNGVTRDDLVMTKKEAENLLKSSTFVIEEKVDGANIGLSMDENFTIRAQNRSHYVNSSTHKQFSTLDAWINEHSEDLYKILSPPGKFILFGEWLFAKHSIHYTRLPSLFLAFDIFDVQRKEYLDVGSRDDILNKTSIQTVPKIAEHENNLTRNRVMELLDSQSQFYDGFVEGLVFRKIQFEQSKPSALVVKDNFFADRGKVVRPDFLQQIEEQWTRQKFVKNILTCYY